MLSQELHKAERGMKNFPFVLNPFYLAKCDPRVTAPESPLLGEPKEEGVFMTTNFTTNITSFGLFFLSNIK